MIIYYFWSISEAHVRSYECYFFVHFLAQRLKKKKNERKKISEEERLREEEEKEDERNSRKNEEAEREA